MLVLVAEEIKIEVKDGRLTISGARQEEKRESTDKYQRIERSSGSFSRSLMLPRTVDQDKISASHDNGVLRLTMPKVRAISVHENAHVIVVQLPDKSKEPKTIAITPTTNTAPAPAAAAPAQPPASNGTA